jgi:hypothetical protein
VAGSCEHGNESWGSIKDGEFIEELSHSKLRNKDSAPRS